MLRGRTAFQGSGEEKEAKLEWMFLLCRLMVLVPFRICLLFFLLWYLKISLPLRMKHILCLALYCEKMPQKIKRGDKNSHLFFVCLQIERI